METSALHLGPRFTQAVDYARHVHIERRKGTSVPSMAHLLGVASLVMGEAGRVPFPVTEEMVIAAILHDAVEDHGGAGRLADIAHNFGPAVAHMVKGLSDTLAEDPSEKEPWEQRKQGYLDRLRQEPPEVQLISAADKLYNARTVLDEFRVMGAEVWKRFKRGRNQQIWYYRELLRIFKDSSSNRIVDEFERVLEQLERTSDD